MKRCCVCTQAIGNDEITLCKRCDAILAKFLFGFAFLLWLKVFVMIERWA